MTSHTGIPVVDLSLYGLQGVTSTEDVDKQSIQTLADQICGAFRDIGFCYISNHGIPQSQIDHMKAVSRTFFENPTDVKKKFKRPENGGNHGWVGLEVESLNPERPGDFKEAFNFTPSEKPTNWPDVPGFESTFKDFFNICHTLSLRLFDLVSIGLKLGDDDFLRKCHNLIGQKGNTSGLRSLFYPPLPQNGEIKPNQVRCGEHSDYGSLTLLFQDDVGGLEVRNLAGEYVPAPPIPGTILINLGDLMQQWTADELLATKHRVLIPKDEIIQRKCRQSLAFFLQPDDEVIIKCLDGSEKYTPISSFDYLQERFSKTY